MTSKIKFLLFFVLVIGCVLFLGNLVKAGSWAQQTSGTGEILDNVNFIDSNTGWVVGGIYAGSSVVLKTTNGGTTWIAQNAGVATAINDISFFDSNNGWGTIWTFGSLIHTSNGGTNWTTQNISNASIDGVKAVSALEAYAVGYNTSTFGGTIWYTSDSGSNWTAIYSSGNWLNDIECISVNNCIAVGNSGRVVKFTGTATATNISTRDLLDVSCVGTYCAISGREGVAFYSSDSGATWTERTTNLGTTKDVDGIAMIDQNRIWAVGSDTADNSAPGPILYTSNGGQNWSATTNSQAQCLLSVDFVNSANGWMVGCGGKIFKYTGDEIAPITTASPAGGTYKKQQTIALSADEDANIYYTIDGSTPTTSSTMYISPFTIYTDATLKFFSVDLDGNIEVVKTENYKIRYQKIKLKKAIKNILLYGKSNIDFKFTKLPSKKVSKYYVKIKQYSNFIKNFNQSEMLKRNWRLTTNLYNAKKQPKFKVKITLHYNKKLYNSFKKQTGLKEKDLRVFYKAGSDVSFVKAKHSVKKRTFKFNLKKFPAKIVYYGIARSGL